MALREPKDLAWFLASYARDALERVEAKRELPGLASIKSALEEALGMKFEADKGEHFFRSTLVQTLFYGVFSSWVLWARQTPPPTGRFEWREAVWHLNVPFVSALYQQLAAPKQLQPLGLVELLDWTEATLNRIDNRQEFLQRFNDADAVQFFYEPFLEAFDPVLRKELGVWYTPSEVVTYMVARVDKALREDLGVADGLASDNVYVLDPCCGTGAYVAAVLRRIDRTLTDKGYGALKGQMVKKAALERVLGFEIMPAPFIVAHLQVGSVLQGLGASLDGPRARQRLPHQRADRLGADRHQAAAVPRAGGGAQEGREAQAGGADPGDPRQSSVQRLCRRGDRRGARPDERLSRDEAGAQAGGPGAQRPLRALLPHGRAPHRRQDRPRHRLLHLQLLLARRPVVHRHARALSGRLRRHPHRLPQRRQVQDRQDHARRQARPVDLLDGAQPRGHPGRHGDCDVGPEAGARGGECRRLPPPVGHGEAGGLACHRGAEPSDIYEAVTPPLELGLPFVVTAVGAGYFGWPKLPELLPVSFPGVKTSRDDFLVSIDRDALERRLREYFDSKICDEEIRAKYPAVMAPSGRFDPLDDAENAPEAWLPTRATLFATLIDHSMCDGCTGSPKRSCLTRSDRNIWPHAFAGNRLLDSPREAAKGVIPPIVARSCEALPINFANGLSPSSLADYMMPVQRLNLPPSREAFLASLSCRPRRFFSHRRCNRYTRQPTVLRTLGRLRMDWPRIPLPGDANLLRASSALGATLATLLDPETPAPGVSAGTLRAGLKTLGLPTKRGGKGLDADDLKLAARWGSIQNAGSGRIVMPGPGLASERAYTDAERAALAAEGKAHRPLPR